MHPHITRELARLKLCDLRTEAAVARAQARARAGAREPARKRFPLEDQKPTHPI